MCTTCGCGQGEGPENTTDHGGRHHHHHEHGHAGPHTHDFGAGPAHAHAPGLSQARMVQVERDILGRNNQYAADNRRRLREQRVLALNLMSGPGSGKTTLLVRTIDDLGPEFDICVVEGDQQTANDAERIRETGARAVQINTGKGCHLDAHMVGHALDSLAPAPDGLLFIENVGNLVCPATFDLGEAHKVVILSVTEGEDKPLKYPDMFHAADLVLLNKIDLLPYVRFDVDACLGYARRINPGITVFQVSAATGEGLPAWYGWIRDARRAAAVGA